MHYRHTEFGHVGHDKVAIIDALIAVWARSAVGLEPRQ